MTGFQQDDALAIILFSLLCRSLLVTLFLGRAPALCHYVYFSQTWVTRDIQTDTGTQFQTSQQMAEIKSHQNKLNVKVWIRLPKSTCCWFYQNASVGIFLSFKSAKCPLNIEY